MRLVTIFINSVIIASLFMFYSTMVYAHVGIGEYAGTHTVTLVPEPRSPFVGEEVLMTFYLRDLHGSPASEPFVVGAVIQEVKSPDSEQNIFATALETITNGIYKQSYRFAIPGSYRVEFGFSKPDEPEIIRDAIFDIDVRDVPHGISYVTAIVIFSLVAIFMFLGGTLLTRHWYRKRKKKEIR